MFFLQKIIFKKEIEMKRDRDAVQVPVLRSESLSLEAPETIRSGCMCEGHYSDL